MYFKACGSSFNISCHYHLAVDIKLRRGTFFLKRFLSFLKKFVRILLWHSFFFFFSDFCGFFFLVSCKNGKSLILTSCKTFVKRELFENYRNVQNYFITRDCCEVYMEKEPRCCLAIQKVPLHHP